MTAIIDPSIVERVPVRSCVRRGATIDLVLDRGRENRSQFVFATARNRQVVFWQSARTRSQARPNVSLPTARASGVESLEVIVDSHERYAWKFSHQQATTVRRALTAGDYAVERDGQILAAVERKSLADLVATVTGGKLWYLLAALASLERAAVVVEDRYSKVFKLDRVRPVVIADALGEAAVRYPSVPIVFCETRSLAQEWTYRFLGAAVAEHRRTAGADAFADRLPAPGHELPDPEPTTAEVRAWARTRGLDVPQRGRLRPEIWAAYHQAHAADGDSTDSCPATATHVNARPGGTVSVCPAGWTLGLSLGDYLRALSLVVATGPPSFSVPASTIDTKVSYILTTAKYSLCIGHCPRRTRWHHRETPRA